ncbi:MAG: hypothetical protein Kow0042_04430 [Calditrichia bacterium]
MKNLTFKFLGLFMMILLLIGGCELQKEKKMVTLPVTDDPTVSFRLWFKVGSQNDPVGKEGLAVLTAHLITEGATQKHSLEEINEILYPMAARIQNQVDKEMTIIYGRTHQDNLEAFYSILKEVVQEPAFKEEDFNRIRTDLINYVDKTLRYADDEELGKAVLSEFIFRGTIYEHLEEGYISSLKNITVDDVKDFYQKYYTADNLTIGLGGGFTPEFAREVEKDFQTLPSGKPGFAPKPEPDPIHGLEVLIVEKDAQATAISFGFPIDVLRGSRDYYALAVANSWLGEHRNSSSHLYQVIREARGLNYGDYSYIEHFPMGGRRQFPPANVARRQQIFEVWIRPVPNDAKLFAFRAALRELQKLVDNGMSPEDFELTKKFLKNYILHYAPTTMMKLGYALDDVFYGIEGSHLEKFKQILDQLTLEDVNQAIKKHLQYQNIKVVFVTNEAEKLKEMLVKNLPSPITYTTPKPQEVLDEDVEIANYPLKVKPENVKIVQLDELFQ